MIFSTRPAWRPPPNSVVRNSSTIFLLVSSDVKRPEMQTTLPSLCSRKRCENSGVWMTAARMPATLSAVSAMPMPVPQMSTPRSASPAATVRATLSAKSG